MKDYTARQSGDEHIGLKLPSAEKLRTRLRAKVEEAKRKECETFDHLSETAAQRRWLYGSSSLLVRWDWTEALLNDFAALQAEHEKFKVAALQINERIRWILAACEIDRDARHELEALLSESEAQ